MMARNLVLEFLSFCSRLEGSMFKVSGSTSAKTGRAPARTMELALAKKLKGEVITSSPGEIPAAINASHNASVPEAQPIASLVAQREANSRSKATTSSPRMYRWESQTRVKADRT